MLASLLPLLVLCLQTPAPASPTISAVPFQGQPSAANAPIKLGAGEFELLTVNLPGPITWDVSGDLPLKLLECKGGSTLIGFRAGQTVPGEYVTPQTPTVAIYSLGQGQATIAAWGLKDGKPTKLAQVLVECGQAPRPPPGPGPRPDVNDALAESIRAIYGGSQEADKAKTAKLLAALYRQGDASVDAASTTTQLYSQLSAASKKLIGTTALQPVRERLADHLNEFLSTPDAKLTPELKAKTKREFARIAAILEGLK